jgi:predicted DCC family thiol-disulfide oxidoreductase YuxK
MRRHSAVSRWIFEEYRPDAYGLAIYRVLVALVLILFVFPRYQSIARFPDSFFLPPPSLAAFFTGFPPGLFFSVLMGLISLGLVCLLVGLKTPLVSLGLAALILVGNSFRYSFGKIDHDIVFVLVLAVMAASGWGRRCSLDARAPGRAAGMPLGWPLALLALLVGLAMFSAALTKATTGWLSFSSQAVKGHLLNNIYSVEKPAAVAELLLSIDSPLVWELMDWGTVLLEGAFLPAALSRRAMRVVCALALPFHAGIHFAMLIFFLANLVGYAAFVEWERLLAFRPTRQAVQGFRWLMRRLAPWHIVGGGLLLAVWYRLIGNPIKALGAVGLDPWIVYSLVMAFATGGGIMYLIGVTAGWWIRSQPGSRAARQLDQLSSATRPLVLFDGRCGLCSRWVDFVLARDRKAVFRFAPLQSTLGKAILARHQLPAGDGESIILVSGTRVACYSTATLEILRRLPWPWPLFYGFILIPPPLRNTVYDFVARRRFRWFGQLDTCRVLALAERARFVDSPVANTPSDS